MATIRRLALLSPHISFLVLYFRSNAKKWVQFDRGMRIEITLSLPRGTMRVGFVFFRIQHENRRICIPFRLPQRSILSSSVYHSTLRGLHMAPKPFDQIRPWGRYTSLQATGNARFSPSMASDIYRAQGTGSLRVIRRCLLQIAPIYFPCHVCDL